MRGEDRRAERLFSYVNLEARIPARHPLRTILALADQALQSLSRDFDAIYAHEGRPSIPPERLLRALLLQAFYSIRSERQLMEQLNYNLLFRWFVGLSVDDPVWDVTVFTKNRDRLLEADVARKFLGALMAQPKVKALVSDEHFSVDGTLLEAAASMKSFVPKDTAAPADVAEESAAPEAGGPDGTHPDGGGSGGPVAPATGPGKKGRNAERDFHGEKRSNQTHASATDPDARLYRKGLGKESKLCHMGHVLMENRNGLVVETAVTPATGTAERDAALAMLDRHLGQEAGQTAASGASDASCGAPVAETAPETRAPSAKPPSPASPGDGTAAVPDGKTVTLGADKGYDAKDFIADLTRRTVAPHVAQNTSGRRSAVPDAVARTPGYAASIRVRKRIEEIFGWMKTVGGHRKLRHRGTSLVGWLFTLGAAAYNLVRLSRLVPGAA
jgi:transposase